MLQSVNAAGEGLLAFAPSGRVVQFAYRISKCILIQQQHNTTTTTRTTTTTTTHMRVGHAVPNTVVSFVETGF